MLRVAGILNESIVDGPGIRAVVFFQGCPRHCEGCHNPSTLPFEGGMEYTPEDLAKDVEFLQAIKKLKPGLNVWCYTGYVYNEVKNLPVLKEINVLVDGPFILAQRDLDFPYRGSRNQRLIDVPASLEKGEAVDFEL